MPLLADDDVAYLKEQFDALAHDVTLTVVARESSRLVLPGAAEHAPDASEELRQIASEVAATSPRLKLESVDAADSARAHPLVGERTPALVFHAPRAKGRLRYYGLPAGYEMSTVVATIVDLGAEDGPLPPDVEARVAAIARDVHIQVFVTPS
jgi:alkyl hydroperoxide reductase subunit AhpF